jgi:hypothetical protein
MHEVRHALGGSITRQSVTNVLTDTVRGWAYSHFPAAAEPPAGHRQLLQWHPWDPHGIYPEVHVPVPGGKTSSKACDLAVLRPGGPDIIIEIDRKNNRDAVTKLRTVRDSGAVPVWIRWDSGPAASQPGIYLIDLRARRRCKTGPTAAPSGPR